MAGTIFILALVIAAVVLALRYTLKHPDSCEGCGSSCSCGGSCSTKASGGRKHGRKNREGDHAANYMEDRSFRDQALENIWNETRTDVRKC
ncbi:MAG: FeoB-associated Cys-rich membrane protein [Bilifractor sp.]|nr:FeoB-associated Cys-rich membrane protein [Bilifractor sp.]